MTSITLQIPTDIFQRLQEAARACGMSVADLAVAVLAGRLDGQSRGEHDQALAALAVAGLLVEPTEELRRLAAESTLSLEEARAILARGAGPSLSELVDEQRGPRT